jgi:hypothetical protein
MPGQLIERILAEWREGERLLRQLPPADPDRETVRMTLACLREKHAKLSEMKGATSECLADCADSVEQAHRVIVGVHNRHADLGREAGRASPH